MHNKFWKKIPNFPYEVSKSGLVRRVGSPFPLKPMRCGQKRKQYSVVRLCAGARRADRRVHVLVLEAFVSKRPKGLLGCHKNDDTNNNSVFNLYWGTHNDNTRDRCLSTNRLSKAQIKEIRKRLAKGERGISKDYGVSYQTICDINKGRRYVHY